MDVEQRHEQRPHRDLADQDHDEQPSAAGSVPFSDELLVDMVRTRENLFDKGRVDYKDEQAKAQAWDGIASALGMRVEDCQTRWVRLRERFGRELRLHKRGVPPGKEWALFSRMRWLERFIQPRNRVGGAKAHVAALHAAMARDRGLSLSQSLSLGLASMAGAHNAHKAAAARGGGDPGATATPTAGSSAASDSGDGMAAGGEDSAVTTSSGPLWTHTYKLWAASDHMQHHHQHQGLEDEDSQQDMAVDLATHASHTSTPRHTPPSGTTPVTIHDFHHHGHGLGGLLPAGPPSSPQEAQDFQDAVRQSLAAVAGSLERMERHLSRGPGGERAQDQAQDQAPVQDPDELFARSLAATLRRLPRPRRSQAKMRLIAVLAEFEEEC